MFVIFIDPGTCKPIIKVFEIIAPSQGQEAASIKAAIKETFKMHALESAISKIIFLSSEGTSVNCGKISGLIKLFQDEFFWISFIWCFSHLKLVLKDALKEYMEPEETLLHYLYYLYIKSSKKHNELKNIATKKYCNLLKDQYQNTNSALRQ